MLENLMGEIKGDVVGSAPEPSGVPTIEPPANHIYLVRHGEFDISAGNAGHLTHEGGANVEGLAKRIQQTANDPARIISSTILRNLETAHIIATALRTPVENFPYLNYGKGDTYSQELQRNVVKAGNTVMNKFGERSVDSLVVVASGEVVLPVTMDLLDKLGINLDNFPCRVNYAHGFHIDIQNKLYELI